jgi:hypothetical protein
MVFQKSPPESVKRVCRKFYRAGAVLITLPSLFLVLAYFDPEMQPDQFGLEILLAVSSVGLVLLLTAFFLWKGSRSGILLYKCISLFLALKPSIVLKLDREMYSPEALAYFEQ